MKFSTDFECTPQIEEFVYKIADEMVRLFEIQPNEAAGRINRQWRGQQMLKEVDELSLFHNDANHWAKLIYYGHDGLWRSRKYGPQPPLPYP